MIECIKPYLYKRRKNALIRPFNSADKNPSQAGSAYSILETTPCLEKTVPTYFLLLVCQI